MLDVIRPLVGLTENPLGSNKTLVGQWYGFDGVAWCAETVSYGLYLGGFNDGQGHITLSEPTTDRGWAYVPFLTVATPRRRQTIPAGRVDCFCSRRLT